MGEQERKVSERLWEQVKSGVTHVRRVSGQTT